MPTQPPSSSTPDLTRDLDHNGIVDAADDRSRDLDHDGVIDADDRLDKDLNHDNTIDATDRTKVGTTMGWVKEGDNWSKGEALKAQERIEQLKQSQSQGVKMS